MMTEKPTAEDRNTGPLLFVKVLNKGSIWTISKFDSKSRQHIKPWNIIIAIDCSRFI